jgi:fibronectin type 3 domain-containing protein
MAALESQFSAPVLATAQDSLAPAKVMNLAYTVTQGQVHITWDPVTTNSDGSTLTDLGGYRVYRRDDAGSTRVLVGTVGPSQTDFTDTTMLDGASYIYTVTAIDDEATPNESEFSDDLAVKTIPSVPTGLATTSGDGVIRLTWNSVKDGANPKKNENLAGYKVYRKVATDPGAHVFLGQTLGDTVMFEDNTVVNGTEYSYVVTAFDNTP